MIVSLLLLAGIAFVIVKYVIPANSKTTQAASTDQSKLGTQCGTGRAGRNGQGRGNFTRLHGTIASINNQTVVMTADDKSTKNLTVTSTTRISEQQNGQMTQLSLSDLKVGDEINVMGGDTTSANLTPRMIIIGTLSMPQGGGGWQRPNSGSGGSSSDGSSGSGNGVQFNSDPNTGSSSTNQI